MAEHKKGDPVKEGDGSLTLNADDVAALRRLIHEACRWPSLYHQMMNDLRQVQSRIKEMDVDNR